MHGNGRVHVRSENDFLRTPLAQAHCSEAFLAAMLDPISHEITSFVTGGRTALRDD